MNTNEYKYYLGGNELDKSAYDNLQKIKTIADTGAISDKYLEKMLLETLFTPPQQQIDPREQELQDMAFNNEALAYYNNLNAAGQTDKANEIARKYKFQTGPMSNPADDLINQQLLTRAQTELDPSAAGLMPGDPRANLNTRIYSQLQTDPEALSAYYKPIGRDEARSLGESLGLFENKRFRGDYNPLGDQGLEELVRLNRLGYDLPSRQDVGLPGFAAKDYMNAVSSYLNQ